MQNINHNTRKIIVKLFWGRN